MLSAQQIKQYDEQGFLVIENFAAPADCDLLRARAEELVRGFDPAEVVSIFSTLGVFSYSIYLTHELVIMQSWRWTNPSWWQLANVFVVVVPAVIVFAWVFFWFCEKPFMVRRAAKEKTLPSWATQPSAVGD